MRKTSKTDLEEFVQQLENLPTSGFLHLFSQSVLRVDKPKHLLPLTPRSIQARVCHKVFQSPLPPTLETIQKLGEEFVAAIKPTAEEKTAIEEKTRLQANAVRWHEERFCRLTASNFGNLMLRRSGFDKLAKDILFTKVPSGVPSIKWGHDHEPVAFQEYEKWLLDHSNLKLKKSGIRIGEPPYLGASPDGILEDTEGNLSGIIEIKCPYSAANLTVREACEKLDNFYCYIDDNDIKLKTKHVYFYQVLGTMAIGNASFCHFIIWTPKLMETITITFDQVLWEEVHCKLTTFYNDYMLPLIIY